MTDTGPQQKTIMPSTGWGEMRALLTIGIPMALAQLVQFSPYFADTVMIARIGPDAVAAAAMGSVIYFLLWMSANGPISAVTPLVAQALGRDRHDTRDVRRTVRMSIWFCFATLPLAGLLLAFTAPILTALGQDPQVAELAARYVWVLAPGLPFALAVMSLRNFLASIERTLVPFVLVAAMATLNIGLNWVLIFGNLGAPRLGLIGAGVASSLSFFAGFIAFVVYIGLEPRAKTFEIFSRLWQPDWTRLRALLSLGWPISVTVMFEGMLFNAGVLLAGAVGVIEQAAFQIALNAASMAFMMPWGMSMAGAVRIGLARGADNRPAERRAAATTILASLAAIGLFAVPFALVSERVAAIYFNMEAENTRAVFTLVVTLLPLAAGFMFFDAVQVACNQLLRGLADVRWPMIITGVSYWAIGFPVAYVAALPLGYGAQGVFWGLTAGLFAAFIGLGTRLWLQIGDRRTRARVRP